MTYKDIIWEPKDSIDGNNKLKTMVENDQYLNEKLAESPRGIIKMFHKPGSVTVSTATTTLVDSTYYLQEPNRVQKYTFHWYDDGGYTSLGYDYVSLSFQIDSIIYQGFFTSSAKETGEMAFCFLTHNLTAGQHTIKIVADTDFYSVSFGTGWNFVIEDIGQNAFSSVMSPS